MRNLIYLLLLVGSSQLGGWGLASAQLLPHYTLLQSRGDQPTHPLLRHSHRLTLDRPELERLRTEAPAALSLTLPIGQLMLAQAQVRTEDFRLTDHTGRIHPHRPALHYRGSLVGRPEVQAAASFLSDRLSITLFTPEGSWNLGPVGKPSEAGTDYILFCEKDFTGPWPHRSCATRTDDDRPIKIDGDRAMADRCRLLTKYFECDYQMFEDFNGDIVAVMEYVESMYNVVAMLFDREEISTRIAEIEVWTEPDPYREFTNSGEVLGTFSARDPMRQRPTVSLGHLLASGQRGLGGVAFFHALCTEPGIRLAFSNITLEYLELPFTSWTVTVVAHEMGHNLNCRHTQSCWWPGGAIDGCYTVETDARWCGQPERPRPPFQGTVMSYCHLLPDIGMNLNLGFGPLPGAVIREYVRQSACLPLMDCACHAPRAPVVTPDADFFGATLQWVAAPFAADYEVELARPGRGYQPAGTTTGTTFRFENLTIQGPDQVYWARIRSRCDARATADTSAWTTVFFILAPPQVPTCSDQLTFRTPEGRFEDGSGAGTYSPWRDCRWLIDVPGAEAIELTLLRLDTEAEVDMLRIYSGPEAVDSLQQFEFSGSEVPETLSLNGSQVLVRFTTDGATAGQGWEIEYRALGPVAEPFCSGLTELTDDAGTLGDGSASLDYRPNSRCEWRIQPANAQPQDLIDLDFTELQTVADRDFISIYDGPDDQAPLLGRFSGKSLPDKLIASSGQVFVRFESGPAPTAAGWTLHYQLRSAFNHIWCNLITRLEEPAGIIEDGSGSFDYGNNTYCRWVIQPPNARRISLRFTEFSTEADSDWVWVYNGSNLEAPVLGAFSGQQLPPVLTTTGGAATILFYSNGKIRGTGWQLEYSSETVGRSAAAAHMLPLQLIPNPATDRMRIDLDGSARWIDVFDARGRVVWSGDVSGRLSAELDVSGWAAGLYAVRVSTERGFQWGHLIRQ